jgi:acetyl esterase/lipase
MPATSLRLRLAGCALAAGGALAALAADSRTEPRLADALKQFPEADRNRDGILTLEEAQSYAKAVRKGKTGKGSVGTLATAAEDSGSARHSPKKPAPTHADIAYGPHERNRLDLWLAVSAKPTPLIVYIHGGGFVAGSKDGASAEMINGALAQGVSFMAINYRFRPGAPIQAILRDCARSIQFVRAHATRYNLDPQRIASYGGSAGAGSSLWLAVHDDLADPSSPDPVLRQSSRIVAAGAINGQATYRLDRWAEILGPGLERYERPGETAAFYGAASPEDLQRPDIQAALHDADMLAHLTKDDPPLFLFTSHPSGAIGNRGHLLHHPDHARAVKRRADELGIPAQIAFALEEPRLTGDYQQHLLKFLLSHLKP